MAFDFNVSNLFSRKKNIQNIKADELRREEIGLQNEERRIEKDINRLRAEEQQIISEYSSAKANNDEDRKVRLARKIQEFRSKRASYDKRHDTLSKQKRMISGLILIKENTEFLARITGSSKLNSMDMVEIQAFVEQETLDGDLTNDKLANLVKAMDDSSNDYATNEVDSELGDLMAELDATALDNSNQDSLTSNSDLTKIIDSLDKAAKSQSKINS